MREWFRKKVVYIKRNPQIFPKLMMLITCCFFTFSLTPYSYAAVDITSTFPAISLFIVTLLSFLMVISFLGVKNDLKKKPFSTAITLAIIVLMITLQIIFVVTISKEIAVLTPEQLSQHASWPQTVLLTIVHLVFLVWSLLLIVTMPLYGRLLLLIKTAPPKDDEEYAIDAAELILGDEDDADLAAGV